MPRANRLTTLPKRIVKFIEPMDCAPVPNLPDGSNWAFEIKLDGYRAVAVKSDRGVNLFSRRHKSFNHQYPHLVEALGDLPEGTVVDGEVVALDESGRPNFNLLQNFRSEAQHIHYFIFDSRLKVRSKPSLKDSPHCESGNGFQETHGTIKVSVADVRVEHEVKTTEFTKWLDRPGGSPREMIQRQKVRSILGMPVQTS